MEELEHSGPARAAVYAIIGRARTLHRKRVSHTRLFRDESERLARLARMLVRTTGALGSRDKAMRRFSPPNHGLTGTVPLQAPQYRSWGTRGRAGAWPHRTRDIATSMPSDIELTEYRDSSIAR